MIEVDGELVATAIGTLELGIPNPKCTQGRTVRLANVITLPEHRGHGYGTRVAREVIDWACGIGAHRVDLSATPEGQHVYDRLGFTVTSAPRMKLVFKATPQGAAWRPTLSSRAVALQTARMYCEAREYPSRRSLTGPSPDLERFADRWPDEPRQRTSGPPAGLSLHSHADAACS